MSTDRPNEAEPRLQLSSEQIKLSPQDFTVDNQGQIVINRRDLAEVVRSASEGAGVFNRAGEVEVVVSVGVKF